MNFGEAAQAEAVLDEVSILQAALQEVQRKRGIGSVAGSGSAVYPGGSVGGSPGQEVFREQMRFASVPEVAAVPGYNVDLAAYGAQLKGWIDMQVDARLNVVIPQFLNAEIVALQQDIGATTRSYQRMESDIDLVKNAHTKLFSAVECLSEDFEKMRVQSEALAAVEKVVLTVEELKQSAALRDRDSQYDGAIAHIRDLHDGMRQSHETNFGDLRATLEELRRSHEGLHSRHENGLADFRSRLDGFADIRSRLDVYDGLHGKHDAALADIRKSHGDMEFRHRGLLDNHGRLDSGLTELHEAMTEVRRSQNALQESHHSGFADFHRRHAEAEDRLAEQARFHGDFTDRLKQKGGDLKDVGDALNTLRDEVASLAKIVQDQDLGNSKLEKRLLSWQAEIHNDLTKELKTVDDTQRVEAQKIRELENMLHEVGREVSSFRIEALKAPKAPDIEEYRRELRDSVQQIESRLCEELEKQHRRFLQDTRHLKSEAAAIAALDEQLWLTDQRLGQRIDELAHSHRESITVVERRIGNMVSERVKPYEVRSPRTQGGGTVITVQNPSSPIRDLPIAEEREARETLRIRRPLLGSAETEKEEVRIARNIHVDSSGRVTEAIGATVTDSIVGDKITEELQEKPNGLRSASLYANRPLRSLRETSESLLDRRRDDGEEETQRFSYKMGSSTQRGY
jgi:hypothetical protein